MARTAKTPDHATVIVTRRQLVTFSGRTLGSVELTTEGLLVTKKRERGGRFDKHRFPLNQVLGFVEGEGGRKEPAYATVLTTSVIRRVSGDLSYDNGWTVITDDDGVAHYFRSMPDTDVVVVEGGEKPQRGTGTKTKPTKKKTRGKPAEEEDDDDQTEDDDDQTEDDDDQTEDDDSADGGEEAADDEEEEEVLPRSKAAAPSKTKAKPAIGKGKAVLKKVAKPDPKAGKPGRRVVDF